MRLKSPVELERMHLAGQVVAGALRKVREALAPGVSTQCLDEVIRDYVLSRGGTLLFYNYKGFPASSCISINEEVVHGIPRKRRKLEEGDIVSVDIGVRHKGFCGDAAWTFPVGRVGEDARRLLEAGEAALMEGVNACRAMRRVSDIARAIQAFVEGRGYYVVKQFVGHGIGTKLHEEPQVPNYVDSSILKQDAILRPGLVLAIEPMVNQGTEEVVTLDDGWTVVTADRGLSVHFEHTVAVTADGPWILTADG
ncbi:MAG: type I methionyl aminopeptidase [Planctomycetes bacterium]|nr:type I methionyl aminopeptidase [Planctomycetota bacterium]